MIEVNLKRQTLMLWKNRYLLKSYTVSTAKNGAGEVFNSYQTPRGKHEIIAKIGAGFPIGSVFSAREWTGEIYHKASNTEIRNDDFILSRILWLSGLEEHNKNTKKRHIYIHGTPDDNPVGVPVSRGCIRMRNEEIIELFDLVYEKMPVFISE